jgi:hypothetical protein
MSDSNLHKLVSSSERSTSDKTTSLINLHKLGFKLVPLNESGKPVIEWSPIYDNPEYWTAEKLIHDEYKFKNVATCFGKTNLRDDKGPLYLNALDIDSQEVYNTLFRLQNEDGPEYSLIPFLQERTVVVKTRKPYGFHLYWLSHSQHNPILTTDCKQGYEFEIKGDKSLSTLPPSSHREDANFHYKNQGKEMIWISDEFYDRLINTLGGCLKHSKRESTPTSNYQSDGQVELSDVEIQIISAAVCPYYKKPYRHTVVLALSGVLHKSNVSKESTLNLIQVVAKDDEEIRSRVAKVEETYQKD